MTDHAQRVLQAIDAFEMLEEATCGKASIAALREHYGLAKADQIETARANIEHIRSRLAAPLDEREAK